MAELKQASAQPHKILLERAVHRNCPNCIAPGEYKNDKITRDGYTEAMITEMLALHPEMSFKAKWFREGWPGCYVDRDDSRLGKPVGAVCPNCGASRALPKKLNKIRVFGRII